MNSNFPQNPYNLNAEIASGDTDIRQHFNLSGLYRLPIGRGQKFLGNWSRVSEFLLGGWQINGILTLQTGSPINVVRGASISTCPGVRPNLVGDPNGTPPPPPPGSPAYFFNVSAFSVQNINGCDPGRAAET